MANDLGKVRRSAAVMTNGPGAVIDFRTPEGAPVSGVASGLEKWEFGDARGVASPFAVQEVRLMKKLGVSGFRLAPVTPDSDDFTRLTAIRFPKWLQCPRCGVLAWANYFGRRRPGEAGRICPICDAGEESRDVWAIPVRFITACRRGHIDDFPWHFWVKHKEGCNRRNGQLTLLSKGAGLAGIRLSCVDCGASRSLDGIFSPSALQGLTCKGKRPWLTDFEEQCDCQPVVLQRGASNLYFPNLVSSLEIPPWGEDIEKKLNWYWDPLVKMTDKTQRKSFLKSIYPSLGIDMDLERFWLRVEQRLRNIDDPETDDLRWGEYLQFVEPDEGAHVSLADFEIRVESAAEEIADFVSKLTRVVRLREVRALTSFTRIAPRGTSVSDGGREGEIELAGISKSKLPWLPAVEVRGEGIFLALNESRVIEWLSSGLVRDRIKRAGPFDEGIKRLGKEVAESDHVDFGGRLLLAHSLAHMLILQLSLECGYSSASIRERLYVGVGERPMCGVVIYTATTDSDGTMGGLQRQGLSDRFSEILVAAVRSNEWCSSDPLCISERLSLSAEHNLSACHSCLLVSETSCENFNQYLDRGLVVGTPEFPELGFFRDLVSWAEGARTA